MDQGCEDQDDSVQNFTSGQGNQKISRCVPTGNFEVRTISSTSSSPKISKSPQKSPKLPFFGEFENSTQFHKFPHPSISAIPKTTQMENRIIHFNDCDDIERGCDIVDSLPLNHPRDPQLVKFSSDSRHCSPRTVNFEIPNRQSKTSYLDRGTKDKSNEDTCTPTPFHIPYNFSSPNLCKSTYANNSIIDRHMSDVLLLALFKGFRTPEFCQYMCSLQERLLSRSEMDSKLSTKNRPKCVFCEDQSYSIHSDEFMNEVNGMNEVHNSDFGGISPNGDIPFSNDIVPQQKQIVPKLCSYLHFPIIEQKSQNFPSCNNITRQVDPLYRHCVTPSQYPPNQCRYVSLKENILPLKENVQEFYSFGTKSSIEVDPVRKSS
ncbi:hypothetical protein LOD99_1546 [Oopsacas minuta]|uniref:Uncharacterized protein n=1 Tax=Oopsacas minuta TaxID=111878 RepID=A0AAV7K6A0_9METZ|nr:hypothetical protein LOD99_1546 [Oopsacas minuta]